MKLIIAQGNPGLEYTKTRHNVGFLAFDLFSQQHQLTFQSKPKFHAEIAEISGEDKVLFIKPTTFYNETGQAARAVADFYKVSPGDILVIHDDLALPFGTIRTREKGSPAGNNGIKSLNAHLGEQYARIRVGIWTKLANKMNPADFVLAPFTAEEITRLNTDILPKTIHLIDDFIAGAHTSTSHSV